MEEFGKKSLHLRLPCTLRAAAAHGEVLENVREPHNIQGQYAMSVKKRGTFTTKVVIVKSVFVLLATRGHNIYSDQGRGYSVDMYIALNSLSCTVHKSTRVVFIL